MNWFLYCDWLPEPARWRYLAHSRLLAVSPKKNFCENHIINALTPSLFGQDGWILALFFCASLWTLALNLANVQYSRISRIVSVLAPPCVYWTYFKLRINENSFGLTAKAYWRLSNQSWPVRVCHKSANYRSKSAQFRSNLGLRKVNKKNQLRKQVSLAGHTLLKCEALFIANICCNLYSCFLNLQGN